MWSRSVLTSPPWMAVARSAHELVPTDAEGPGFPIDLVEQGLGQVNTRRHEYTCEYSPRRRFDASAAFRVPELLGLGDPPARPASGAAAT